MSLQLKTIYNALVGAWGGLLAWVLLDLLLQLKPSNVWVDAIVNGALVGLFIGALVSSFGGLMEGRIVRLLRGLIIGALTGVVGGILGLVAGEAAFQVGRLFSEDLLLREAFRAFGWAIFGIGIGMAEGLLTLSPKRLVYGGLGGIIGGLAGGIAFIAIARLSSLQLTNRAVGFALLGAFIGLFVAFVPILMNKAILKITSSGRSEGKEFLLDKPVNVLGSSDSNDVGLFGDKAIAKKHAEIRLANGQFTLYALPGNSVWVNNAAVTSMVLQDGMQVRLGNTQLVFQRKRK